MTDKEIKEAVERFSATDWVNPYNRKAMKTLLDLAQSVLNAKMPEKKELKFNSSIEEKIRIAENSIINTFRLYQAKKMLGLEEVINKVAFRLPHEDAQHYNIQYLPFLSELATAIRKHMEE